MSEEIHLFFFGLQTLDVVKAFCLRETFYLPFASLRRGFSDGVCEAGLMKHTLFFLLHHSRLSFCCFCLIFTLPLSFLMDSSLLGEKYDMENGLICMLSVSS